MDLNRRHPGPELIDDPLVSPDLLREAMDQLHQINRWLRCYQVSVEGVASLLPPGARQLSVLDVGCGTGESLRAIAAWCRGRGIEFRGTGIELSEETAAQARLACRDLPNLEFRAADLFSLEPEDGAEIVHASQVLHHFPGDAAARALEQMYRLAGRGVVVNDLHRHPVAWHGIRLLTAIGSRNPLIRHDAPLSIARGFSAEELRRLARGAGAEEIRLAWRFPFRWLLVAQRSPIG